MNKSLLVPLGILIAVIAAGLVLMLGMDDAPWNGAGKDSSAPEAAGGAGHSSAPVPYERPVDLGVPDPTTSQGYRNLPPTGNADGTAVSQSVFAHSMAPIELNFDKGPFEKRTGGTVLKTDTVAQSRLLNNPDTDPMNDLNILGSLVDQYRRIFGANPVVGENREMVMALTGNNPHHLVFVEPSNPAISASGELVDRWETPFRFHAVSSQLPLEIFSAGPDKAFGTADDVMIDEPLPIGPDSGGGVATNLTPESAE